MKPEKQNTDTVLPGIPNNFGLKPIQLGVLANCKRRQEQLEVMLENISPMMTNVTDVTIVGPLVRDFMNLLQKNDEQMLKVAEQLRKEEATDKKVGSTETLLDEREKEELLRNLNGE